MSSTHSTWPVILISYNLPPWMCMKRSSFILLLLISDPTSHGNNIDVYLQSQVEELKELWDVRVKMYDVSSKKSFQMHVALLWTINDFLAYGDPCNYDSQSRWLRYERKFSYIGHKQFLDSDHKFRKQKQSFDRHIDIRSTLITVSGGKIMLQTDAVVDHVFRKKIVNLPNKRKEGRKI